MRLTTFAFLMLGSLGNIAQAAALDTNSSDPVALQWMQGFPPPANKQLQASDGSFFQFPALRWSVAHMRQFMPTVEVSRGLGNKHPLDYQLDSNIEALQFTPANRQTPITFKDSLDLNYTDGLIILHRGKIVYERYIGEFSEDKQHAAMSVTKSITGLLAAILVAEGHLDEQQKVVHYIPELKGSAFADASVREVMDMTTALQFSEDYANPKAEIWAYSAAANPPANYQGPIGYYAALKPIKKAGVHGRTFGYKTPNADLLGWLVARASNQSVHELLSKRIWQRLGMEQSAYYSVDQLGTPYAGGGFNAGLRDMARLGELIRNQGQWQGQQIIPAKAIKDISSEGDKTAFARSPYSTLKGWSYRSMWWHTGNSHKAFAARGVHGQTLYIDPKAEMVLVRFASHPTAANGANDPTSLPAYQAVAEYLLTKLPR